MAVDLVQATLDFIVAFMGLTTVVILFLAKSKLSKGALYNLMNWMFYAVIFFALPYSVLFFLLSSGLIVIADQRLIDLSARVLITLFFLAMLRAAFYAKSLADLFGFKTFFPQIEDKKR
ncbi:hypothetical protein DRN67_01155 [Candidatus Micrarchaeota archaeon]|nr:MAG: hypothetical protein DRN67_01155 [Candidatus Micrarchaeota archaeon]